MIHKHTKAPSSFARAYETGQRDGLYRARHEASQLLRKLDELIDQADGVSACEDETADRLDARVQRSQYDEGGAP